MPKLEGPTPHCPSCGKQLDGYDSLTTERAPREGDYTVCFYCLGVARYAGSPLQLQTVNPVDVEPEMRAVIIKTRRRLRHAKAEAN